MIAESQTQEATEALDMNFQELGDKRPGPVTDWDILTRPQKKTKISVAIAVDLAE
jgi:hypothetical protein